MATVDYDGKAAEYAEHRRHNVHVLERLLAGGRVERHSEVLEIGCGTGNYIIQIRRETDATCYGVDRSKDMLSLAVDRSPAVRSIQATVESLPFLDQTLDFAYFVDVLHHVADVSASLREAFRVLRSGARVCTTTDTEETIRQRLHSHYFPEGMLIELDRYPALNDVEVAMAEAGFRNPTTDAVESPYRVTSSKPYRDKAFSELHLISQDAHERGLARLDQDLQAGPIDAVDRRVLVWANK